MTTRPELHLGTHLWRGLAAVALFVVLAAVFLTADFGSAVGFGDLDSITRTLGYALFDIPAESVEATGTESFLVPFIIVAVVLDAALEAAVMLARREEGGEIVSALSPLGGEE